MPARGSEAERRGDATIAVLPSTATASAEVSRAPGAIRPMVAEDATEVADLYRRVFHRSDEPASAELVAYVRDLAFGAPVEAGEPGGFVHLGADARIDAAVIAVPMRFVVGDRIVAARVLSTFMADDRPDARRPGARLAMHLARSGCEFLFTDTARAVSADLFAAFGGAVLPLHSLEWLCVFRPIGLAARLLERRAAWLSRALAFPAGPIDRLARRIVPSLVAPDGGDARLEPIADAEFIALAPRFVAHRTVRPLWAPDELAWALAMARRRDRNGPLRLDRIVDRRGETIGVAVHWSAPGRIARVLDLPTLPGREAEAVTALLAGLDRTGIAAVRGMVRPGLAEALYRVPGVIYRHNAHAVCLTPFAEARDAVARGDVHLGGLAGESWSRLISDF